MDGERVNDGQVDANVLRGFLSWSGENLVDLQRWGTLLFLLFVGLFPLVAGLLAPVIVAAYHPAVSGHRSCAGEEQFVGPCDPRYYAFARELLDAFSFVIDENGLWFIGLGLVGLCVCNFTMLRVHTAPHGAPGLSLRTNSPVNGLGVVLAVAVTLMLATDQPLHVLRDHSVLLAISVSVFAVIATFARFILAQPDRRRTWRRSRRTVRAVFGFLAFVWVVILWCAVFVSPSVGPEVLVLLVLVTLIAIFQHLSRHLDPTLESQVKSAVILSAVFGGSILLAVRGVTQVKRSVAMFFTGSWEPRVKVNLLGGLSEQDLLLNEKVRVVADEAALDVFLVFSYAILIWSIAFLPVFLVSGRFAFSRSSSSIMLWLRMFLAKISADTASTVVIGLVFSLALFHFFVGFGLGGVDPDRIGIDSRLSFTQFVNLSVGRADLLVRYTIIAVLLASLGYAAAFRQYAKLAKDTTLQLLVRHQLDLSRHTVLIGMGNTGLRIAQALAEDDHARRKRRAKRDPKTSLLPMFASLWYRQLRGKTSNFGVKMTRMVFLSKLLIVDRDARSIAGRLQGDDGIVRGVQFLEVSGDRGQDDGSSPEDQGDGGGQEPAVAIAPAIVGDIHSDFLRHACRVPESATVIATVDGFVNDMRIYANSTDRDYQRGGLPAPLIVATHGDEVERLYKYDSALLSMGHFVFPENRRAALFSRRVIRMCRARASDRPSRVLLIADEEPTERVLLSLWSGWSRAYPEHAPDFWVLSRQWEGEFMAEEWDRSGRVLSGAGLSRYSITLRQAVERPYEGPTDALSIPRLCVSGLFRPRNRGGKSIDRSAIEAALKIAVPGVIAIYCPERDDRRRELSSAVVVAVETLRPRSRPDLVIAADNPSVDDFGSARSYDLSVHGALGRSFPLGVVDLDQDLEQLVVAIQGISEEGVR